MEKALQNAHGVGYEVYKREARVRIQIEKKRETEYVNSQHIVADLGRKLNIGIN